MASSSRDRITVDLHDLKAALLARARQQGVLPSALIRTLLASALAGGDDDAPQGDTATNRGDMRVRLSLRMHFDDVGELKRRASQAGLSTGDFVAALMNKAPALESIEGPRDQVAALTQSCSELATLSRSLRHLTALLRQGSSRAAQEYRGLLDTLDGDVRSHLAMASGVAAEISPLVRPASRQSSSPT